MRLMLLLLAIVVLAGCATSPSKPAAEDAQGTLRDCDKIGSEAECLSNPACETFYQAIFEAIPGTNEYSRRDVYMNCHVKGALP